MHGKSSLHMLVQPCLCSQVLFQQHAHQLAGSHCPNVLALVGLPDPADVQSLNHLLVQTLNTQVEAALQSGLNFKDRFTTTSRKRLLLVPVEDAEQGQRHGHCAS